MSFVAKNPLSMAEIENTPSTPTGTRGLFAKKDGFYEVDENGNSSKLYSLENLNISKKYYGDAGIIPSPEEWFNYETNEDNTTVTITGFSEIWFNLEDSNKHDIVIPYEINNYIVNSIGRDAFDALIIDITINSIIFPNTIKELEGSCFIGHVYLNQIKFADNGLEIIGNSAFSDNSSLEYINIPNSVISIGASTFTYCTNLASINIPDSVISIGKNAFFGCKKMTSIKIPDSVSDIGVNAFDPNTTIICSQGSYAETYAKENGYEYIYDLIKEIKVDAVLDSESENPVQNKHITQHISDLMNADANLASLINSLNNEVENTKVFVVEAIVDNENNTISANANYFDVENAYNQGKNIILKMSETNSTNVVIGFLNGKTNNDSVVWSAVLGNTNMQAELNKEGWNINQWQFMERFETVKDVDIEANVLKVTFGDNVVKDIILPAGGSGGGIIVDSQLNDTSTNPVQNKVLTGIINMIINDKANTIHSHSISEINQLETELSKKLNEERVSHGGEATETWDINISGKANEATYAEYAFTDSQGNKFSTYTKEIVVEQAEDKSVKLTEWTISGPKESALALSNYRFATADYVEEKLTGKLDKSMVDNSLSSESENPVQNKVIDGVLQEIINNKAHISHKHKVADLEDYVVDEVLDSTSTNPVQNKVVANELNKKISEAAIMADRYLVLYKLDGTNIELEVATPTYVDNQIGSIETALDNIIAIQNTLIGGDSV